MTKSRTRRLDTDRLRALGLLSDASAGCTTRVLLVHGIGLELVAELAETGLVSMQIEPVIGGSHATEVTRVWITEAGRLALRG